MTYAKYKCSKCTRSIEPHAYPRYIQLSGLETLLSNTVELSCAHALSPYILGSFSPNRRLFLRSKIVFRVF